MFSTIVGILIALDKIDSGAILIGILFDSLLIGLALAVFAVWL